jgi:hypothetical protein
MSFGIQNFYQMEMHMNGINIWEELIFPKTNTH